MDSNPENRNKTRFAHESRVTLENTDIGFRRDARMYNFSDFGIYLEADFKLEPQTEILVGISDSPFASQPDKYERYRGTVKWRKVLKRSSYYYGYGVKLIEEVAQTPKPNQYDGTREHPRKEAAIPVKFECDNEIYEGIMEDVSSGGAFIKTDFPPFMGQMVKLEIPLKKKGKIARLTGEVTRTKFSGFGVKFIKSKQA